MRPGRAAQETRRARAQADRVAADLEAAKQDGAQVFASFAARLDQVEANTARITRLEAQMAEVIAALPRLKDAL